MLTAHDAGAALEAMPHLGVEVVPVLVVRRSVDRSAIDLPPMHCKISFGSIVGGVRRVRIELPTCHIDERAIRKSDDAVSIGGHGSRGGIGGCGSVPANPRWRGSHTQGAELACQIIARDPALVVRKRRIRESPVTSEEVVDLVAHRRQGWRRPTTEDRAPPRPRLAAREAVTPAAGRRSSPTRPAGDATRAPGWQRERCFLTPSDGSVPYGRSLATGASISVAITGSESSRRTNTTCAASTATSTLDKPGQSGFCCVGASAWA
jgi:hypothetical protein